MFEELCQKFKTRRKELGIDLEEAVEKTKLHPSVIKALESGNLESISPIYLKGFIKIYASFLGVRLTDELDQIVAQPQVHIKKTVRPRKGTPEKAFNLSKYLTPQVKKSLVIAAIVVVSVVLVVNIIAFFIGLLKKATSPDKDVKPKAPVERLNATSRVPAQPSPQPKPKLQAKPAVTSAINVSLKFKRDCFIRVILDGKIVFEGVLKKGTLESWAAEKEIEFKISDGSSVDVEVNGKLLPPLSKIRTPIKSLKITPKSVSIDK